VKRINANRHVLHDHDSFVISNDKWAWNAQGLAGHNALDYLIKVDGMDFVEAVKFLTDSKTKFAEKSELPAENAKPPPKAKQLSLPKANANNDMAAAYLMSRGISKSTIWRCINAGVLYESVNKNCVFIGKDGNIPKYACERSIYGDGKKDVLGSDKKYGFYLPPEKPVSTANSRLIVFESPIDLLAHLDIMKMAGNEQKFDGFRLSLGGVSSVALNSFLEHNPQISQLYLCLDADKSGQDAARRIAKELLSNARTKHIKITISPPPIGKDFSDTLGAINRMQKEKNHELTSRRQQAVI
jgi:hypothetical protein